MGVVVASLLCPNLYTQFWACFREIWVYKFGHCCPMSSQLHAAAGVFVDSFFRLQLAFLMDPLFRYLHKSWRFAVDAIVSVVATICAVNGMSAVALAFLLASWCFC